MNKPDWDGVLQGIQVEANKKQIQVEMSLLSKIVAPGWVNISEQGKGEGSILIAQGTGVIHALSDISFTWTLPFLAWDFPETNSEIGGINEFGQTGPESVGGLRLGRAHLDFGPAGLLISPYLKNALIQKIEEWASPMSYIEDMPTLQDSLAVIKQFLVFEYAFSERRRRGDFKPGAIGEFESKLRQTENLLNWAFYWLRDRQADPEQVDVSLSEFLHALRSCWNVGEIFKFSLMDDPTEIGHVRGEAEG
jgi:hypothetical protein